MTTSPASDTPRRPRARLVRAYTMTGGRTRPPVSLPLEATLRVVDPAPDALEPLPRTETVRDRVLRTSDGRSVAEVSALLGLPLGVARVLLGDLVESGLVEVQDTMADDADPDSRRALIERVLSGLRAL